MSKFEEQIASITAEPIVGGAVVTITSTRQESAMNPRAGRPRVKSASVFVPWADARGICEALAGHEDYNSPGSADATEWGFYVESWDGEPHVRGVFQLLAGDEQLEADLSGDTQLQLLAGLRQALEAADTDVQLRFYDHRGLEVD